MTSSVLSALSSGLVPEAKEITGSGPNTADRAWESLADWWALAGVDAIVAETPCPWLNLTPVRSGVAVPPPASRAEPGEHQVAASRSRAAGESRSITALPEPLPGTMAGFLEWWRTVADAPIGNPPSARLAPGGPADAELMILTDMPEADDRAAGTLLGGSLAPMLDRMLAALGTSRDRVWLASLMAVRPLTGRIDPQIFPLLARLARHQLHLLAPKKLWLMGEAASRVLGGMAGDEHGRQLPEINHHERNIITVTTAHPRLLAANPRHKKAAWLAMQPLRTEANLTSEEQSA